MICPDLPRDWCRFKTWERSASLFPWGWPRVNGYFDACAAPGGKTALIAEREPDLAKLVAVDIDPQRLSRVGENLSRGNLRAELVSGDAGIPRPLVGWRPFRAHFARRGRARRSESSVVIPIYVCVSPRRISRQIAPSCRDAC